MVFKSAWPQWFTMHPPGVLSKLRLLAIKYITVPARSAAVADIILKQNVFSDPDLLQSNIQGSINIDLKKETG